MWVGKFRDRQALQGHHHGGIQAVVVLECNLKESLDAAVSSLGNGCHKFYSEAIVTRIMVLQGK
jgi:G:T-mismatch repair DNA endonuclease (very short patch repair protein)